MKKLHIFKLSGLCLLGITVAVVLTVFFKKDSGSRILLSDDIAEQRKVLHNADGDHACHCFMPLIPAFNIKDVTDTSATFEWECSTPATYQVKYGTTSAKSKMFPTQTPDASYTKHSITVTGLEPETEYHAGPSSICTQRCGITRANLRKEWLGEKRNRNDWTFTTKPKSTAVKNENKAVALQLIKISDVTIERVTAKDVSIIWKTNVPATSLIEYGLTKDYGMKSGMNMVMTTKHHIQLFDLTEGKTYHFRAVSYADESGGMAKTAMAQSEDYTFTTPEFEERIVNEKNIVFEPNPCSEWTLFSYFCYQPMKSITIDIFTLSGKVVASLESPSSALAEGWNKVRWNVKDNKGKNLKNGLYVYRMMFKTLGNNELEVKSSNLRVLR